MAPKPDKAENRDKRLREALEALVAVAEPPETMRWKRLNGWHEEELAPALAQARAALDRT